MVDSVQSYNAKSRFVETNMLAGVAVGGLYGYLSKPWLNGEIMSDSFKKEASSKLAEFTSKNIETRTGEMEKMLNRETIDLTKVSSHTKEELSRFLPKGTAFEDASPKNLQNAVKKFIKEKSKLYESKNLHDLARLEIKELSDTVDSVRFSNLQSSVETLSNSGKPIVKRSLKSKLSNLFKPSGGTTRGAAFKELFGFAPKNPKVTKEELAAIIKENADILGIDGTSDKAINKYMKKFGIFNRSPKSIAKAISKKIPAFERAEGRLIDAFSLIRDVANKKNVSLNKAASASEKMLHNMMISVKRSLNRTAALKWAGIGAAFMAVVSAARLLFMGKSKKSQAPNNAPSATNQMTAEELLAMPQRYGNK